jgi:hypothetical protein
MILSSLHYLIVNVPYVHFLSEYSHQFDISLPPRNDPKFLACCVLSQNLSHLDFKVFQYHSLKVNTPTILNGPTSRDPVDLNQVSMDARQLVHFSLFNGQENFDSGV